jgi:hypothetical protein
MISLGKNSLCFLGLLQILRDPLSVIASARFIRYSLSIKLMTFFSGQGRISSLLNQQQTIPLSSKLHVSGNNRNLPSSPLSSGPPRVYQMPSQLDFLCARESLHSYIVPRCPLLLASVSLQLAPSMRPSFSLVWDSGLLCSNLGLFHEFPDLSIACAHAFFSNNSLPHRPNSSSVSPCSENNFFFQLFF